MSDAFHVFKNHYPEYLMEAAELGIFMLSAIVFATLLESPESIIYHMLPNSFFRLFLMGVAMAITASLLIYSKWGQRSGAHFNPAVTLTFYRLGKISFWDTVFYILFQILGGIAGVGLAIIFLNIFLNNLSINYAITIPGPQGIWVAFLAEFIISFALMFIVLVFANIQKFQRYVGIIVGLLLALYIPLEAPYSGMSMNPARTLASSIFSGDWTAFWIYMIAPLLAMLLAGELYLWLNHIVMCAKLNHCTSERCIFNCGYKQKNHR